jgi:hypothetical protein
MENEGGQEADKCSKRVLDRGDRFLLVFNFVVIFYTIYFRFRLGKKNY